MDRRAFHSRPPTSLDEERSKYHELQHTLLERWLALPTIDQGSRDVVIVPSLSLEGLSMTSIPGVTHYEERMLFTLALLRHPRAHLVYVTSEPLHPATVDYHLSLLQGIPTAHARKRLTLLSTYDASSRTLTEKILERPRLIERIRKAIDPDVAHMSCFTVSKLERSLAVRLGVPLFGIDPDKLELGTKGGSRRVFEQAGIRHPAGIDDVSTGDDIVRAATELWEKQPETRRLVVKHAQGFSGEGNAVMSLVGLDDVAPGKGSTASRRDKLKERLHSMHFTSTFPDWEAFQKPLATEAGVVEVFIEGVHKRAPSAQLRINPLGELECVSTHDQLVGGPDNQSYQGCRFPADEGYRLDVQADGLAVGEVLVEAGVIGRAAVDFVAVEREDAPGTWDRYAIEINLRMSGTTHPSMILKMLNGGRYDEKTGMYFTGRGESRCYISTDSLMRPSYRGLLVEDLLDIAAVHELHYRPWTDSGVVFHLMGALSQYGKVGYTAIGRTFAEAERFFEDTRIWLDTETG